MYRVCTAFFSAKSPCFMALRFEGIIFFGDSFRETPKAMSAWYCTRSR